MRLRRVPSRRGSGLVTDLSHPAAVMLKLAEIEMDLARRQNPYEEAARRSAIAKREREHRRARAFVSSQAKTVAEKQAHADIAAFNVDEAAQEAEFVAIKAVVDVLEARAMICQSLLKAQGRIS